MAPKGVPEPPDMLRLCVLNTTNPRACVRGPDVASRTAGLARAAPALAKKRRGMSAVMIFPRIILQRFAKQKKREAGCVQRDDPLVGSRRGVFHAATTKFVLARAAYMPRPSGTNCTLPGYPMYNKINQHSFGTSFVEEAEMGAAESTILAAICTVCGGHETGHYTDLHPYKNPASKISSLISAAKFVWSPGTLPLVVLGRKLPRRAVFGV